MKVLVVGSMYSLLLGKLLNKNYNLIIYSNGLELLVRKEEPFIVGTMKLEKKTLKGILEYYKKLIKLIIILKKMKDGEVFINHYLLEIGYLNHLKLNIVEDGVESYNISNSKLTGFQKIKYYLKGNRRGGYRYTGLEKEIKKIYLTGLAPIPEKIFHKVEIISLKKLWNKKTLEEQNKILDIFSFDLDIKDKIKERDIILFTQPLSEDKIITEEEKIKIYSKIIKKYPKNRLIIKIHPREKTNYRNIFEGYLILDNPFPFEILNLLNVKFKKAVTLFSTAALSLGKEVEVDFYGTEVHTKILERFGSCDNVMKRNCFLEEE